MNNESVCKSLAHLSRALPPVRGKEKLGRALTEKFFPATQFSQPIVPVRMRDGSRISIDLRSRMEAGAFWSGLYEPHLINRLCGFLQAEDVVLDIGSNIGFITIPLGRRIRELKSGHLYAFEPVASNYAPLVDNITQNGLTEFVTPLEMAMGAEEGTIDISREGNKNASSGNAVFADALKDPNHNLITTTVTLRRLDAVADEQGITRLDLIKIDVEGAEVLTLRGGHELVQKFRPVCAGEFNTYWMEQVGFSFMDVWQIFQPLDYSVYQENASGNLTKLSDIVPGLCDVFLIPNDLVESRRRSLGI